MKTLCLSHKKEIKCELKKMSKLKLKNKAHQMKNLLMKCIKIS
jgi:hypothetical protein